MVEAMKYDSKTGRVIRQSPSRIACGRYCTCETTAVTTAIKIAVCGGSTNALNTTMMERLPNPTAPLIKKAER